MSCLGSGELIVLAIVIAIIFSASRMGQLGENLGRFVNSFKRASGGQHSVDVPPVRRVERGAEDAQVVDPEDPSSRG